MQNIILEIYISQKYIIKKTKWRKIIQNLIKLICPAH